MTGPATTIFTPATDDDSWRDDAACLDMPGDVFFPVRGNSRKDDPTYDAQIAEAKAICAGCPVRVDCLDWALATGQAFGIWGGLTPDERRPLQKARDGSDWRARHICACGEPVDKPEKFARCPDCRKAHKARQAEIQARRERVAELLALGATAKAIAATLGVSDTTVRADIHGIKKHSQRRAAG